MARPLVSDELWELIEPLIQPLIPKVPRRHRFPGRRRIDDRKVLTGILALRQPMNCAWVSRVSSVTTGVHGAALHLESALGADLGLPAEMARSSS
jgi:hypothetical protein